MRTEIKDAGGRTTGWIEEDGRVKDATGKMIANYNKDSNRTFNGGGKFVGHNDQRLNELGKRNS
jgi:hypothetical protein